MSLLSKAFCAGVMLLPVTSLAQSPFIRACLGSDYDAIKRIVNGATGPSVLKQEGAIGMCYAISGASNAMRVQRVKNIITLLVKKGVDLNKVPGGSILLNAARIRQAELIKHLLGLGANPNASASHYALNALYVSLTNGDTKSSRLLIEAGADPNAPGYKVSKQDDVYRGYPLHVAAFQGLPEIITLLLKKGAKVNIANSYGQTALHIACLRPEGAKVIATLLKAGADRKAKWDGMTPLEVAKRKGVVQAQKALGG